MNKLMLLVPALLLLLLPVLVLGQTSSTPRSSMATSMATTTPTPPKCHIPGQCELSILLTYINTNNSNTCLEACKDYDAMPDSDLKCMFFSLNFNETRCALWNTCPRIVTNCNNCETSEVACDLQECDLRGICQGGKLLRLIEDVESLPICLTRCASDARCQWVTHNPVDNVCFTFDECPRISSTTTTNAFTSAQRQCRV